MLTARKTNDNSDEGLVWGDEGSLTGPSNEGKPDDELFFILSHLDNLVQLGIL